MAIVLVKDGLAHELFNGTAAEMASRFAPGILAMMVEYDGPVTVGQSWDGVKFYTPPSPAPTADDVRAEASRRLQVLFGARDGHHLDVLISNASREAIRLIRKGVTNWTPAESARAAELEAADAAVEAIRAASNAMEADPPANYTANAYWP